MFSQNLRRTNILSRKLIRHKYLVFATILLGITTRITYALSRNLFFSGPDANGYIPAIEGFAKYGYFSSKVPAIPFYPSGYPLLLSALPKFFGDNWIQVAQVLQILTLSLSTFLFYLYIRRVFSNSIGFFTLAFILLSPALIVISGEAMYETFLISFLMCGVYFGSMSQSDTHESLNFYYLCGASAALGIACAIHPRTFLLIPIFFWWLFPRKKWTFRQLIASISIYSFFVLIPLLRNLVAVRKFTFTSSFWPSIWYNKVLAGCNSISCVLDRAVRSPWQYFKNTLYNSFEYWSPHSGPLERGSWFHNLSLIAFAQKHNLHQVAASLSWIVIVLSIAFWLIGSGIGLKEYGNHAKILFGFASAIFLTDFFVLGDNRHRIVASIFMAPFWAIAMLKFKSALVGELTRLKIY